VNWQDRAQCGDLPLGAMFPEDPADEAAIAAKHCPGCPVAVECLAAGMGEKFGVWGGLTTAGRRKLRKSLAAM
jgi:WhiB family transcriptional regulator, redox-sensing transcriptional regulator